MYGALIYALVLFAVLGIIALIRWAVRSSRTASTLSQNQHHLALLATPFALGEGERMTRSFLGRNLGAMRQLAKGGTTEDNYPGSFPLVYATNERIVILMSNNDQPSAITGIYPAAQPNLRRRIGEQFGDDQGRFVSSVSLRWDTLTDVVTNGTRVALAWTDREGDGTVYLTLSNLAETPALVDTCVGAVRAVRTAAGTAAANGTVLTMGATSYYSFEGAQVTCADCGSTITPGDRFCTGCGAPVQKLETA
jgi:hypothetical protein